MKKITYIISFIFLFTLYGCDNWLTIEPENDLIKEEFWKSADDVQAMLASTYGSLRNTFDEMIYWSELRGGNVTTGNSPTSNQIDMFNYNIFSENSLVKWGDFYKVINYANTLIKFAPQVVDIDPTFSQNDLKRAEAEAVFLRSLCYFTLVKAFRDVPLVLEPYVDDSKDVNIPKTPEKDIIKQLIIDLEEAKKYAPTGYAVDNYTEEYNKGRVTVYAVEALLADIYLWDNQYDKCISECDNIINSFKFGLVVADEYFSLYSPGNSIESIFELQSDRNLGQTNNLFSVTGNVSGASQDIQVSDYFVDLFSTTDKRGTGVSFDRTSYSIWKYVGFEAANPDNRRVSGSQSDANWIYYRLADMYLMKAEAFFEKGETGSAVDMLKIIRGRAGVPEDEIIEESELMDIILKERSKEFIGEGKRWFDLVRFARRDFENRKYLISDAVLINVSPQYFVAVKAKINDQNSWFLPIYYKELEVNNLLEQNPFYEK